MKSYSEKLQAIKESSLERTIRDGTSRSGHMTRDGKTLLNFSSNDYLGLTHHPAVLAAAQEAMCAYGSGSGASRVVTGSTPLHSALEKKLATFFGAEAATLFGAGYLVNCAIPRMLVGRNDIILSDKLVHASLHDGCALTRAAITRYRHVDLAHLEQCLQDASKVRKPEQRVLIVSESVFSMDGDVAPLAELAQLATCYDAQLLVDEAHAVGVCGEGGRGLLADIDMPIDEQLVCAATLSKAFASYGGFCLSSQVIRSLCISSAPPLLFNTSLPPSVVAAADAALTVIGDEPNRGKEVLRKAELFRSELAAQGVPTGASATHIVPVVIGDAEKTLQVAAALLERGIVAAAIREPTVPPNTSRLRFSITHDHSDAELGAVAAEVASQLQGISLKELQ